MAKKRASRTPKKSAPRIRSSTASDVLRIAVSFSRTSDRMGLTKYPVRMTGDVVNEFRPDEATRQKAVLELQKRGFQITGSGNVSVSIRGSRALFEKTFGTKLVQHKVTSGEHIAQATSFFTTPEEAPWNPDPVLSELIDDAYIQWPHLYFSRRFPKDKPSPIPPEVDYFHLRVPGDVPMVLNAARVHRQGITGRDVRVAMIDSGFAFGQHPYFAEQGYNTTVVLAPGATNVDTDLNGHGTGESANLLAVAPDVTFFGIKLDDDAGGGASILEGLHEAKTHNPHVISVSLGYDLIDRSNPRKHLTSLPNSLKAIEAEIQSLVADGIVVVFSAGNGHVSFPGMMPDVISAGGVFMDASGETQASDYASSFTSQIYAGRQVPDFCGLVGMQPGAQYLMLPIPPQSQIDVDESATDGTTNKDGWGTFSGTSAAAPQLAGVCALLLQKNPTLKPADVKAVLSSSARDVDKGAANPASNDGVPRKATAGRDGATGSGLVDAFAAWKQV